MAVGVPSFVGALALAPLVGSEFVPQTDQGFTQLHAAHAGGLEPRAHRRQGAPGRGDRARPSPRSTTCRPAVGGAGQRNQASLNIALNDRKRRASASQKQVEDAIREADRARSPASTSRSASTGRSTSRSSATTPRAWPAWPREFAEKVKKIPGIVDVELSVKPGPAGLCRAPEARRGARTRPDRAAARRVSLRAYVNGDTATYWTTPDGDQVEVVLRLNQTPARAPRAAARPAGGLREGRHADLARQRGDHRVGVQPRGDPAPEPAAPRGGVRRRQGPQPRRRRRRRAEADQGDRAAAGLQLRHRRPDAAAGRGLQRPARRRWRWR